MTNQILNNLITDVNHENLVRFFRERNSTFRPLQESLSETHDNELFTNGTILGEIPFGLIDQLIVCAFDVTRQLTERSGKKAQYDLAKKIIREHEADAGIFVFIGENGNFRFSLVYASYLGTKVDYSNFRRFTYFVSPQLTNKTFIHRIGEGDFSSLESIKEAFSVERVTNQFFREFREIFDKTRAEFEKQNKNTVCVWLKSKYDDEEYQEQIKKFTLNFLGRIIFLYFLLRKGWIEDRSDYIRRIIEDRSNENLYLDVFKPLFFDVFAKQPHERPPEIRAQYKNTPYLNGGLFEHSELEAQMEKEGKFILFSDKFIREIILDFFEAYNFTVDENSPDDQEVSIDPEMLGKVFENTLAEEERNEKGTFYTPREIVHFMVKDALSQFLSNETGISRTILDLIVLNDGDVSNLTAHQIRLCDSILEDIKVLDPAVGSGAFPVEMMQVLIDLRKRLNVRVGVNINEVALKKSLIKNNLYGVDIDPGAIEVAKLRLWLALIVDYDKALAEPLPNLDFQFRVGNSLQEKIDDIDIFNEAGAGQIDWLQQDNGFDSIKAQMIDIKDQFYLSSDEVVRNRLKDQFDALESQLIHAVLEKYHEQVFEQIKNRRLRNADTIIAETAQKIERLEQRIQDGTYKLFKPDFHFSEVFDRVNENGEKLGGFDLVIGNPPYGVSVDTDIRDWHGLGSRDSYGVFISSVLERFIKQNGVLSFIVSDTWLTINSHRELRKQVIQKEIHKIIRLHQDCFDATVNPCILSVSNRNTENNYYIVADLSNVSTRRDRDFLRKIIYNISDYIDVVNTDYAIYRNLQKNIFNNSNIPIPIGCDRNFILTFDSSKQVLVGFRDNQVLARKIKKNGKILNLLKLAEFAKVKKGLATGNNKKFYYKDESGRGNYNLVDSSKILKLSELNNLTYEEKIKGVNKLDYEGRFLVPLDKGVAANIDDDWLPNYYIENNFYVDWSKEAVEELYHLGGMRNPEYQFLDGIAYSWTGFYAPTFRLNTGMVFDQSSSCIFQSLLDDKVLLGILNSKLCKYFIKTFCDHTVNVTASVIGQVVICLPNEYFIKSISELVYTIIKKQKINQGYDFINNEQKELDKIIYKLYNFNKDDIYEVETWYARRYPRLAHLCDI